MNTNEKDLLYKDEIFTLVGAAMEVHNTLGCGFLESVYQEAYTLELAAREIACVPQQEFAIRYKDRLLSKTYIVDFLAYEKIVIEIKALDQLTGREEAQVINYLKASGLPVGLLINFGEQSLRWKRLIYTNKRIPHSNKLAQFA